MNIIEKIKEQRAEKKRLKYERVKEKLKQQKIERNEIERIRILSMTRPEIDSETGIEYLKTDFFKMYIDKDIIHALQQLTGEIGKVWHDAIVNNSSSIETYDVTIGDDEIIMERTGRFLDGKIVKAGKYKGYILKETFIDADTFLDFKDEKIKQTTLIELCNKINRIRLSEVLKSMNIKETENIEEGEEEYEF